MSEERLELVPGEAPRDPEELETQAADTAAQLSPLTRLGPVHLTVSNLGQGLSYYRETVGLEPLEQGKGTLSLGLGERTLLVLVEERGARPSRADTTALPIRRDRRAGPHQPMRR